MPINFNKLAEKADHPDTCPVCSGPGEQHRSNEGTNSFSCAISTDELKELVCTFETMQSKIEGLTIALHDAIQRPKGVVPSSAEIFYEPARCFD